MTSKFIVFLISFLLLSEQKCFCFQQYYTGFDNLSVKDKVKEISKGGVNINQKNWDDIEIDQSFIQWNKISDVLQYDGLSEKEREQKINKNEEIIRNILQKDPQNKIQPSYIDYVIDSQPYIKNSLQKSILVDDFSFEIKKNEKYDSNIFIETQQGKYGLETTKTDNFVVKTYRINNSTFPIIDHHTLCYKGNKEGEGKVNYTLSKSINLLAEFSDPILRLNFSNISRSFNLIMSVTDESQATPFSYPILNCTPNKFVYDIDLLVPKNSVDFAALKSLSFDFHLETKQLEPCFCLDSIEIVPEPFSLMTISLGVAKFMRNKNNIRAI